MQVAKVLSIHSLERGLQVLALVRSGDAMSLRELHRASGVPKPSLLRILKTLGEQGCIGRTPEGAYFAAPGWPGRGDGRRQQAPRTDDLQRLPLLAGATLDALHAAMPWPSDLGVPDGTRMRVVASNRALYGRGWRRSVIGASVDVFDSALGRSWLAYSAEAQRHALMELLLASEPSRRRRREAWERELALTRQRGFAARDALYAGPDSHQDARLSAIAVPVLADGFAVASLSCVWDTDRANRAEVVEGCLAHLVRAAAAIGALLDAT